MSLPGPSRCIVVPCFQREPSKMLRRHETAVIKQVGFSELTALCCGLQAAWRRRFRAYHAALRPCRVFTAVLYNATPTYSLLASLKALRLLILQPAGSSGGGGRARVPCAAAHRPSCWD